MQLGRGSLKKSVWEDFTTERRYTSHYPNVVFVI